MLETLRIVVREHGMRGLYSGIVSPMLTLGLWKGVTLSTQRYVLGVLTGGERREPTRGEIMAASAAGGVSGAVAVRALIKLSFHTPKRLHTCGFDMISHVRTSLYRWPPLRSSRHEQPVPGPHSLAS